MSAAEILAGLLVRSSVLVLAGALAAALLRNRAAELRHLVWQGTLCSLLLLPVVELVAPPLHKAAPEIVMRAEQAILSSEAIAAPAKTAVPEPMTVRSEEIRPFPWAAASAIFYVTVCLVLLFRLAVSVMRVRGLVKRSKRVENRDWMQAEIRESAEIRVPMAAGIGKGTILLPRGWETWEPAKLRAALLHEMEHVRRRDARTALLGSIAVCLFWLNPLVYWMRRRLAVLAEEACDDATMAEFAPEEYARILIGFAADAGPNGSRLIAAVAGQRSRLRKRIEHILAKTHVEKSGPVMRAALIGVFVPLLYVAAAGHMEPAQVTNADRDARLSIGTQQEADYWEARLLRDPENLEVREKLAVFYANEGNQQGFARHRLWLIEHHPEAQILGVFVYPAPGSSAEWARIYELEKAAWERALKKYPDSADVLFHAGLFVQTYDSMRALDLFARAGKLIPADDPRQEGFLQATALIYAEAVMNVPMKGGSKVRINNIRMEQDIAGTLRDDLKSSRDAALFSRVGQTLVQFGHDELGLALIQKAIDLEPGNPKWKEALDWAKAEPVRRKNVQELLKRDATVVRNQ